jgi:hypothetical protein
VLDGLATKSLIRLQGRWELTPLGVSRTASFRDNGQQSDRV